MAKAMGLFRDLHAPSWLPLASDRCTGSYRPWCYEYRFCLSIRIGYTGNWNCSDTVWYFLFIILIQYTTNLCQLV